MGVVNPDEMSVDVVKIVVDMSDAFSEFRPGGGSFPCCAKALDTLTFHWSYSFAQFSHALTRTPLG